MSWDENLNPWHDIIVDIDDVITVATCFGRGKNDNWSKNEYYPDADITDDGLIDIDDVIRVALKYSQIDMYSRVNREYKLWEPIVLRNSSWIKKTRTSGAISAYHSWDSTLGLSKWNNKRGFYGYIDAPIASIMPYSCGIATGQYFGGEVFPQVSSAYQDSRSAHLLTVKWKSHLDHLDNPLDVRCFLRFGVFLWGKFNVPILYSGKTITDWEICCYLHHEGIENVNGVTNVYCLGKYCYLAHTKIISGFQTDTWNTGTISLYERFNDLYQKANSLAGKSLIGYTTGIFAGMEISGGYASISMEYVKYDAPWWS